MKRILWLTWKDLADPEAGGAEIVNTELAKRLVQNGYEVRFIVRQFPQCPKESQRDGYTIHYIGNRYTTYWQAYRWYCRYAQEWPDLIIDEINTIPFFAHYYAKQKVILFVHQLCREIWFHHMAWPLNFVGYTIEPFYLRMLKQSPVITVSESTKADLQRFGFSSSQISCIPEAITLSPIPNLSLKPSGLTLLSLGAIRPMKRTIDVVHAFEKIKQVIPAARLIVAGEAYGVYGQKVLQAIAQSPYKDAIDVYSRVTESKKRQLLQKAHLICVTSIKEGWGLVVTEANSQGTPAVVYPVDGLRDSVKHNKTGWMSQQSTPQSLADTIVGVSSNDKEYQTIRNAAWRWSQTLTFDQSYQVFHELLKSV